MRIYVADFMARYKVLLQLDAILERVHNKTARWRKPYIRSSLDPEYLDKIISGIGATTKDGVDDDYFSDEASLFDSDDEIPREPLQQETPKNMESFEIIESIDTEQKIPGPKPFDCGDSMTPKVRDFPHSAVKTWKIRVYDEVEDGDNALDLIKTDDVFDISSIDTSDIPTSELELTDSDDAPVHEIIVDSDSDDSPPSELIELTRTPSPFGPEVDQNIFEPTKNVVYVEDFRPRYIGADASQVKPKPKPKPRNDFETLFRSTSDGKPRMSAATIWKLIHKDPRRRKSQPEAGPSMSILDAIMDMESDEKYHDELTYQALGGDMAERFAR
jgi:hypothetical protein